MKSETREQLDRYWARELGVTSRLGQALRMCCTMQHWYPGVQLFTNGERLIIASPPTTAAFVQDAIIGASPEEVFSVAWLQRVFGNDAEKILGPAEIHYADDTTFRSAQHHNGRALAAADAAASHALVAALSPQEMEESGFIAESLPTFGAFSGDTLCAVARYEVWPPAIAHISVATHPHHRRSGFAQAAVQALATVALARGLILQWRAVAWNTNSLALARSLGFAYYGSTLHVRLRNKPRTHTPS